MKHEAQQANQARTFHVLDSQNSTRFARGLFAAFGRKYPMRNAVAVGLAIIVSALAGAGSVYLWLAKRNSEIGRIYSVHDIVEYNDNYEGNVMTRLQVYLKGEGGHVKEVNCLFPPGTKITESPRKPIADEAATVSKRDKSPNFFDKFDYADSTSWKGVTKFRIIEAAARSDKNLYYCESLQL